MTDDLRGTMQTEIRAAAPVCVLPLSAVPGVRVIVVDKLNTLIAVLALVLPVVALLVTLAVSQHYTQKNARVERVRSAEQRQQDRVFQAREARYSDRRVAVVYLIAAASDETDSDVKWEQEHAGLTPADIHDDYLFPKLNAANARLVVISSPEVADVAARLREAVVSWFAGDADC